MAEQENLRLVREAYAAFARGDIETVLNAMSDEVVWEMQGPKQIPYAGVFHGKEGVAEFFLTLTESTDMEAFEAQRFIADGDMVVVLGRYAGRVKATGKRIENDWVHTYTLSGGKVARHCDYYDTAKVAQAFERAGTLA